jgi:putative Holliday junction resolvase
MRYLAIDYGTKRTGLAVCDSSEMLATPLAVIEGHGNLMHRIVEIVLREGIEAVVLGLPVNMDDSEGPAAKAVKKFGQELAKHIAVPIIFHDERLSSFAAEELLAPADLTRKKHKRRLDAVAAAQILQSFLEEKHRPASPRPRSPDSDG